MGALEDGCWRRLLRLCPGRRTPRQSSTSAQLRHLHAWRVRTRALLMRCLQELDALVQPRGTPTVTGSCCSLHGQPHAKR